MTRFALILFVISLAIIIAGFLLSAKSSGREKQTLSMRERAQGQRRPTQARRTMVPTNIERTTAQVPSRRAAGAAIALRAPTTRAIGQRGKSPFPWKTAAIGFGSLFIVGLYLLNLVLPRPIFLAYNPFTDSVLTTSANAAPATTTYKASQLLVRLSQLDPAQYSNQAEYKTWAYSACSTASMTEVLNAYGRHYRITDILKVEARLGEITPQLGILEDAGIAHTVAQFGFKTSWGHQLSLDQIIAIANQGKPVIVSFPPDRYAGGHLLVVRGGSGNYVYTADSSLWNHTFFTRTRFLQYWGGFSAIVTPR